ncbi:MAG: hypothetical protein LBM06_08265 [Prevotellaceae bacterium]|jgi:DNA/RNA-binding domain of Phe-tRNA-synthetase-like protein|nr:hypothetical protein [Prevotellaceae bacterium]
MKYTLTVSSELRTACPDYVGLAVCATVVNSPFDAALWDEIHAFTDELLATSTLDEVKNQPAIAATRAAYKRCGKDPGRYRPSAEALRRRLLRGIPLYRIDTLVDVINLVSLRTGFSIGGFDADKIEGNALELGIGRAGEAFEAIGRGVLNIDGLPVYRDAAGGIGTPTSDHERTKIDLQTQHLLIILNSYGGDAHLREAAAMTEALLQQCAAARQVETAWIR